MIADVNAGYGGMFEFTEAFVKSVNGFHEINHENINSENGISMGTVSFSVYGLEWVLRLK